MIPIQNQQQNGRTIASTGIISNQKPLRERLYFDGSVDVLTTSQENLKVFDGNLATNNGFFNAAFEAWSNHYNFSFRPDDIWLMVLQGISLHVASNFEFLRNRFVDFEGNEEIHVDQRNEDSVVRDLDSNYEQFADELRKKIKRPEDIFDVSFSTTSKFDKTVFAIAAMSMTQHFFTFVLHTQCGFPTVTLLGSKMDWEKLKVATEKVIKSFCLEKFANNWLLALLPILDRFIEAENQDQFFWNSMIKMGGGDMSGSAVWYNGWIHTLFPILKINNEPSNNPWCVPFDLSNAKSCNDGAEIGEFPSGLSIAPVALDQNGHHMAVDFCAGFVTVVNSATKTISPGFVRFVVNRGELTPKQKAALKRRKVEPIHNADISELVRKVIKVNRGGNPPKTIVGQSPFKPPVW